MLNTFGITEEDVPEMYSDIVDAVGLETFITLSKYFGGTGVYIPKFETLLLGPRNREILEKFNGYNYKYLAASYNLSERQVRKIVSGGS